MDDIGAPSRVADVAELPQVRLLAGALRTAYTRIDVLANNAGGIFTGVRAADGFDNALQVNYLAPFLLKHLLLDRLVESRVTVVQTSRRPDVQTVSVGHRAGERIDLDDLENTRG